MKATKRPASNMHDAGRTPRYMPEHRTARWHDMRRGPSHLFTVEKHVRLVADSDELFELHPDPSRIADYVTVPTPATRKALA